MSFRDEPLPIDPDLGPGDPAGPHRESPTPSPTGVHHHRRRPDVLVAVATGGALGTLARAALGLMIDAPSGHLPAATLLANVGGSFLLGLVMVVLVERLDPARRLGPFVTTGVMGGFTTFSTFMVETSQLARGGHGSLAVIYVAFSLGGGLFGAFTGMLLGNLVLRGRGSGAEAGPGR